MTNKKTEYTLQDLKNSSADLSVSPPIPREGILGKDGDGTYRTILINRQGNLIVDDAELMVAIDEADSSTTYVGWAPIGSSTSSAVWRIKKIYTSGTVTTITWADGNAKFDNVWDNRASLSYS